MYKLSRCIIQICLFIAINSSPRRSGSPLILELSQYNRAQSVCSIKTCWQNLEGEISKAKNWSSKNRQYAFRVGQQEQTKRTKNVVEIKSEWEPGDIGHGPPLYSCGVLASQFPSWPLSFFIFKIRRLNYRAFKVLVDSSAL